MKKNKKNEISLLNEEVFLNRHMHIEDRTLNPINKVLK